MLGGDAGTAQTIFKIRQLVRQGKKSLAVNRLAIGIVWPASDTPDAPCAPKAQAIFDWVLANTRFVPMIVNAQTLRTADEILEVRAGDCTNLNAILIPALLETVGIPARLVTVASDPEVPDEYTHVYAEAYCDGQWIPMDVARPGAAFGRAPERYFRIQTWEIDPVLPGIAGLQGLLAYKAAPRGFDGGLFRGPIVGRGLGQDDSSDFDWSQLETEIPSILGSTAGLVAAARANPSNIVAQGGAVVPAGTVGAVPAGYSYNSSGQLVPTASLSLGANAGGWLLAGLALVAVLFIARS